MYEIHHLTFHVVEYKVAIRHKMINDVLTTEKLVHLSIKYYLGCI